jgi:hypothetical protein
MNKTGTMNVRGTILMFDTGIINLASGGACFSAGF